MWVHKTSGVLSQRSKTKYLLEVDIIAILPVLYTFTVKWLCVCAQQYYVFGPHPFLFFSILRN